MTRRTRAWAAGAVLSGIPSTVHAVATGRSVLEATRAAGTLLGRRSAVRGAMAHAGISLWWTWAMDRAGARGVGPGLAAGALIAGLDVGLIARRYPAIRVLPPVPQILDHLAFGAVVGWVLSRSRPRCRRR